MRCDGVGCTLLVQVFLLCWAGHLLLGGWSLVVEVVLYSFLRSIQRSYHDVLVVSRYKLYAAYTLRADVHVGE